MKLVSTFLLNRTAQILIGGNITDAILLEQGKGEIISPQLFILMVEIFLIKITRSKNIRGIVYALSEAKAFADDTTLFMERSPENLRAAIKYIQDFHTISGLACNLDKTHVIPIGRLNDSKDIICPELGMTWSDNFTILGFDIDNKLRNLNSNFTKIQDKIKGIARSWAPTSCL